MAARARSPIGLALLLSACATSPPSGAVATVNVAPSPPSAGSSAPIAAAPRPKPARACKVGQGSFWRTKASECNALIAAINRGVQALEAGSNGSAKPAAKELDELADEMDRIAADVCAVALTDDKIDAFRSDYLGMAEGVAAAARRMSKAATSKDAAAVVAAQAAMEQAVRREDPLVDAINQYCQ